METDLTYGSTGFTIEGRVGNVLFTESRNWTPLLVLLGITTFVATITAPFFSLIACLLFLLEPLQTLHELDKTAPKTGKQKLFTDTALQMSWKSRVLVLIFAQSLTKCSRFLHSSNSPLFIVSMLLAMCFCSSYY